MNRFHLERPHLELGTEVPESCVEEDLSPHQLRGKACWGQLLVPAIAPAGRLLPPMVSLLQKTHSQDTVLCFIFSKYPKQHYKVNFKLLCFFFFFKTVSGPLPFVRITVHQLSHKTCFWQAYKWMLSDPKPSQTQRSTVSSQTIIEDCQINEENSRGKILPNSTAATGKRKAISCAGLVVCFSRIWSPAGSYKGK